MSGGVIHVWVDTGSVHPCRDRSDLNCPSVVRHQCTPSADMRTMACSADDVGDGFDDVVVAGAHWFDGSTDSTIPKNAGAIDGWAYLAMVRYAGATMMLVRCELATGRYETLEVPLAVPFTATSTARFTEHAIVHGGRIHALYAPDSRVRSMTYDPGTGVATERANVFVGAAYFLHCRTHGERGYRGRTSTSSGLRYRLATEAL